MRRLIAKHGCEIDIHPLKIDRERLLGALCQVESSGGKDKRFRFEKTFYSGGRYFDKARHDRWQKGMQDEMLMAAGKLTACSFGPWQIMYTVANELGFDGAPWELANPEVSLKYVIRLINKRHVPKITADTADGRVLQLAKGYNAGSITAKHTPTRYMTKVLKAYCKPDLMQNLAEYTY